MIKIKVAIDSRIAELERKTNNTSRYHAKQQSTLFEVSSDDIRNRKTSARLLLFNGTVAQVGKRASPVVIMLDTGSNHDIISASTVKRLGLVDTVATENISVKLADGTVKTMTKTCKVRYTLGTLVDTREFRVLDIDGFDMIFGMTWGEDMSAAVHIGLRQVNLKHEGKKHILLPRDRMGSDMLDQLHHHVNLVTADEILKPGSEAAYAVHLVPRYGLQRNVSKLEEISLDCGMIAVMSPCQEFTVPSGGKESIEAKNGQESRPVKQLERRTGLVIDEGLNITIYILKNRRL